jgi:hypothetical protein
LSIKHKAIHHKRLQVSSGPLGDSVKDSRALGGPLSSSSSQNAALSWIHVVSKVIHFESHLKGRMVSAVSICSWVEANLRRIWHTYFVFSLQFGSGLLRYFGTFFSAFKKT